MRFTIGLLCLIVKLILDTALAGELPSVAFIYSKPPESLLYLYDWIVVDPSTFPPEKLKEKYYMKKRGKVIAYLSTGEVESDEKVEKDCILGENKNWNSKILDIRKEKCFLKVENKATKLMENYDGVFLDTLDSYQMVLPEKKWSSYEEKEVELIKFLRKKFPKKLILVNRAFSIFNRVKSDINGFVAESLYRGIDTSGNYIKMPQRETAELLSKLKEVKETGVPVIVIDYLPPDKEKERRALSEKIYSLGFIPWVTDRYLQTVGEGVYHLIKRQILLVYDPKISPIYPDINRIIQMPLEWLGFSPKLVPADNLPEGYLADRVRGIVVWNLSSENRDRVFRWLKKQINKGIKVFIVSADEFKPQELKELGIEEEANKVPGEKFRIVKTYGHYGFEITAFPRPTNDIIYTEKGTPLIVLKNSKGQKFIPVALTPWGGYGYEGYLIKNIFKESLWVFDPFWLFRKVFGYIPAPDTTTENGMRILTVHIDGDGLTGMSLANPGKTNGEVVKDAILKRYKLPTTASVIVSDVDPKGLHPKKAPFYQKVVKSIFSLPYVEAASHTYSHPFDWFKFYYLTLGKQVSYDKKELPYGIYLKVPGYKPSLKKEIDWSIEFINRHLCPKGKKAKVLLWSGDCLPPKVAIEMTYKIPVYNVNGGDTDISDTSPFLSHVSPMGINRGDYFQVYAPFQNENVYTDNWKLKTGYERVISGFKLTEKPKRLKPISIYYHYYSAYYPASLEALISVYNWATSQEVIPLFLSEYAQKAMEFRGSALATFNTGERGIVFCSAGNLNTLRFDKTEGRVPSINSSSGITGYRKINGSLYVSLNRSRCRVIVFGKSPENRFYLIKANGHVDIKREGKNYSVKIESNVPIKATFHMEETCSLKAGKELKVEIGGEVVRVSSEGKTGVFKVYCPN